MIYFAADFGNFSQCRYKPHRYLKRMIKCLTDYDEDNRCILAIDEDINVEKIVVE